MRRPGPALICWVVGALLLLSSCGADRTDESTGLYRTLRGWLRGFADAVDRMPASPGEPSVPTFGAELLAANANRGTDLLGPAAMAGVELMLDRFRELGIGGVTVAVSSPLLSKEEPDSEMYVAFYEDVARAVRERELKLVVKIGVVFAGTAFSSVQPGDRHLTLEELTADQRDLAQTVIDHMRPDMLTVLGEPDTLALLTGMDALNDPSTATDYVNAVLAGLRHGSTRVGAGSGSWSPVSFARSFAEKTGVDYIDLHLYPVNPGAVRHAVEIAEIARSHGKGLVIGEAWLYKSDLRGREATPGVTTWTEVFRRNAFRFWEPLDIRFLGTLAGFARRSGAEYVSPFWTNQFFAYVEYTSGTADLSYTALMQRVNRAAAANVVSGTFTRTGERYRVLAEER